MKSAKIILLGGCLIAAMAPRLSSAATAATIVSKDAFTDGSYCHMKFPAIVERTLGTAQPVLKDASSGDIIDFYGPCSHDPLGEDEVHSQLIQDQHRRVRDYMD
jgi:hypothetical protein